MELTWTLEMAPYVAATAAPDEAALVGRARDGDGDAFGELVRRHQHRVFRLAGRFFRRREDVEEVAQEAFLAAWRRLGSYQGRAPFEHWLTRICLNCCYARLRRQQRERVVPAPAREPAAPRSDPDAGLLVEEILGDLPAADRFVLLLLDGEGWSVEEIAKRVGWTRVNVKVRAHRARKRLRRRLEAEGRR